MQPKLTRITMMWDPSTGPVQVDAITKIAASLNIQADLVETKARAVTGTAPANPPIERRSKFELVVNLKAAEALGLTIPAAIQARADEVLE